MYIDCEIYFQGFKVNDITYPQWVYNIIIIQKLQYNILNIFKYVKVVYGKIKLIFDKEDRCTYNFKYTLGEYKKESIKKE